MSEAEVSETCRCGASTSVKAPSIAAAERLVKAWRHAHPCTTPAEHDQRRRSGTTTTFLGGPPVGFTHHA